MESPPHRGQIESCGGKIRSEQLGKIERREHGYRLDVAVTGRTDFGAAEAVFARVVQIS